MARTVVFANDGSLRIDTSLNKNNEKTEIQYFEQEGDLSKLFQPDINKRVESVQETTQKVYESDKTSLFLEDIEVENIVESYQPLLFTQDTMVKNSESYGVSLNQKKIIISWPTVFLMIVAMGVTAYSLFGNRLRRVMSR